MKWVKKRIVFGVEGVCSLTGHHLCHRIMPIAIRLDKRWQTGLWDLNDI